MTHTNWWAQPTAKVSKQIQTQAQERQNQLTKPQGSLGRLENVAVQLAALQGQVKPQINQPYMLVFAADHGVVAQGVSAFPQSVTIAMLANFVEGGAAVATLCKKQDVKLNVINCGTATECSDIPGIVHKPIMLGTNDFSVQAAMSEEQALLALTLGKEQVDQAQAQGCDFLMLGEMGIGNTSSASCIGALLLGVEVAQLTGAGTGVQGDALAHKKNVLAASVKRAQKAINGTGVQYALQVLQQVGGLEIAAITGAYLRAAQLGIPCFVDGFITTSAALLATHINPAVREWFLFSHHSAEYGHGQLLDALNAEPLLHLDMRLGEGSGAAVAYATVQQALTIHNNMATFEEAAVANKS